MQLHIHYGYEKKGSPVKFFVLLIAAVIIFIFLMFSIQLNSKAYDPCATAFDYNLNGTTGDYQDKSICLKKYYSGREVVPEKPAKTPFKWWFW